MIEAASVLFVLCGLVFLALAVKPSYRICQSIEYRSWYLLFILILTFILGYSFFLLVLLSNPVTFLELGLSAILAGGGAFVIIVIRLSLSSMTQIQKNADARYVEARSDPLTKLYNRLYFSEYLNQAISKGAPFAIIMADLDRFKEINDTLGHAVGDKLLIQIGDRIQNSLLKSDVIARLGGDEFALIINNVDESSCLSEAQKLTDVMEDAFAIDDHLLVIDMSIGIAMFPENGFDSEALLKNADIAMYVAKQNNQNYVLYDPSIDTLSPKKISVISKINDALLEQEFELYYQPILSPADNRLKGFEALIRWPQANGTIISPAEFIPLIEQSRFIGKITRWVILQAIQKAYGWNRDYLPVCMSVNLSSSDVLDKELVPYIRDCLERYPISPSLLCFEITESAIMLNMERAKYVIHNLTSMGVTIALDDFGTGYSSLSLLRELPAQIIKIDRSFVMQITANLEDFSIVKSMLELCHRLGKEVVAEGVETQAIFEELQNIGCDYIQGYYCSKPINYDDTCVWLDSYIKNNQTVITMGYEPNIS
ncbi:MAG: EAL domain-containing protein [Paraglaciecola sp.]|uniref:putative bifunctional diguanylate cyclase/phosphodiesterase n=1 Tax=Paraglaciecola sp. TaxID=1920173 RepID=UPI003296C4A6